MQAWNGQFGRVIRRFVEGMVDRVCPRAKIRSYGLRVPCPGGDHMRDDANHIVYAGTTLRVFDTKAGRWPMKLADARVRMS